MTARRFAIKPGQRDGDRITFDRDESHHLARVLRLAAGDTVLAVDGSGQEFTVKLDQISPLVGGIVVGVAAHDTTSPLAITLVQGIPKGDKFETVIRGVTELGAARIAPALTERTVVRLDAARGAARAERWARVAREATKQCGRSHVPVVEIARPLDTWLAEPADPGILRLCLWEEESAPLARVLAELPAAPRAARIVIGPEGGLTSGEVALARREGWRVVGFGPRLLRTETAGPAVVAVLQFHFGDLRGDGAGTVS
jgi:16S rRNA (uracil1498-N3)-methyltransferase